MKGVSASPLLSAGLLVALMAVGRSRPSVGGTEAGKDYSVLLNESAKPEEKTAALTALAQLKGNAAEGEDVFGRTCFACHVIDDFGAKLGPDLTDAGKRRTRLELARAIADPNAKVDKAWFMETVTTADGDTISGFIEKENDKTLTLRLGAELLKTIPKDKIKKRETAESSTMPADSLTTLTAEEFVDLIEFLAAQKPDRK
jgi:putative heme-binding domain-containing protein